MGGANISFRPRWQKCIYNKCSSLSMQEFESHYYSPRSCRRWFTSKTAGLCGIERKNKNRNGIFFFFCGKVIDDFEPGEERIFFSFGLLTAAMSKITLSIKSGRKKMASLINFLNIDSSSSSSGWGLVNIYHQLRICNPSSWKSLFGQEVTSFCYISKRQSI